MRARLKYRGPSRRFATPRTFRQFPSGPEPRAKDYWAPVASRVLSLPISIPFLLVVWGSCLGRLLGRFYTNTHTHTTLSPPLMSTAPNAAEREGVAVVGGQMQGGAAECAVPAC